MKAKIRVSYIAMLTYTQRDIAELVLTKPYLNKLIFFDIMSVVDFSGVKI